MLDLRLIAITDRRIIPGDFLSAIDAVLEGGATAIMLREKDLAPRDLFELAVPIRELTTRHKAALLISRSVEVALAVGADAVHLGHDALPPETVMRIAGGRLAVGLSAHGDRDVREAAECGLAYVTVSPLFQPTSKPSHVPPIGMEGLSHICRIAGIPVVALGGITPGNAGQCIDTGAAGVAAIGALLGAEDPREAARAFRKAIER